MNKLKQYTPLIIVLILMLCLCDFRKLIENIMVGFILMAFIVLLIGVIYVGIITIQEIKKEVKRKNGKNLG